MSKSLNIALLGNPNTGKTSLFNSLTGLSQKVGNYPGVTVEKKEGVCKLDRTTKGYFIGYYTFKILKINQNCVNICVPHFV